ncbi:Transposon Tf2-6 polyprotein [Dictyocoela muelleri]|nr:Transposon Tf2-6 polyprotein [Dictyocoela muelleri]
MGNFYQWKIPKTKRQLQVLLGKINWYRKFIPNVSLKLFNLYEKLKLNKNKFIITEEEMKPLFKIYDHLKTNMYLYLPNLNEPFLINSDSSEHTIGAVLSQRNGIIYHYSKKLNHAQTNYSIVEKVIFAIYMSILKCKSLIGGSKIYIYTDNKNLIGKSNDFTK